MITLIRKLYRARLLTMVGLLRLLEAIMTTGVNLMVLLRIAAKLHPDRLAIIDFRDELPYTSLGKLDKKSLATMAIIPS